MSRYKFHRLHILAVLHTLAEFVLILQLSQTGPQLNMDQVTENTGEQKLKAKYIRGANTEKFSLVSSVWKEPSGNWEV